MEQKNFGRIGISHHETGMCENFTPPRAASGEIPNH
jgi:hypothetical protein